MADRCNDFIGNGADMTSIYNILATAAEMAIFAGGAIALLATALAN